MSSKNPATRRAQRKRHKERMRMQDHKKRNTIALKKKGKAGRKMCGRKEMYRTEISAIYAGFAKYECIMGTYKCPICNGWHLTKQANKKL